MNRFSKHKWWILTVLLTTPLVALAAGVPNVFAPNTVISSADVNANFTNLANRVTALEGKPTITAVMNNGAGPLGTTGKTAMVTTGGGTIKIEVSGSAYTSTTTAPQLDVAVQLDGVKLGDLLVYTNEINSHKAFPAHVFSSTPAAGSHTIGLVAGNTTTVTDANDYFNVAVTEF